MWPEGQKAECSHLLLTVKSSSLNRDQLTDSFISDHATPAKLFLELDAAALGMSAEFKELSERLDKLGASFSKLTYDPRILAHTSEVLKELASGKKFRSPSDFIHEVKKELPVRTVYRGLYLTQTEAERIKVNGLYAARSTADEMDLLTAEDKWMGVRNHVEFEKGVTFDSLDNYFAGFQYHLKGWNRVSNFMSVSDESVIAKAAGYQEYEGRNFRWSTGVWTQDPSRKIYLIKMRISDFDLLSRRINSLPPLIPSKGTSISIGDSRGRFIGSFDFGAEGTERFIFLKVNPDEIVSIETVNPDDTGIFIYGDGRDL